MPPRAPLSASSPSSAMSISWLRPSLDTVDACDTSEASGSSFSPPAASPPARAAAAAAAAASATPSEGAASASQLHMCAMLPPASSSSPSPSSSSPSRSPNSRKSPPPSSSPPPPPPASPGDAEKYGHSSHSMSMSMAAICSRSRVLTSPFHSGASSGAQPSSWLPLVGEPSQQGQRNLEKQSLPAGSICPRLYAAAARTHFLCARSRQPGPTQRAGSRLSGSLHSTHSSPNLVLDLAGRRMRIPFRITTGDWTVASSASSAANAFSAAVGGWGGAGAAASSSSEMSGSSSASAVRGPSAELAGPSLRGAPPCSSRGATAATAVTPPRTHCPHLNGSTVPSSRMPTHFLWARCQHPGVEHSTGSLRSGPLQMLHAGFIFPGGPTLGPAPLPASWGPTSFSQRS
mmetsp:Transcript_64977/g.205280  ORF Transcript_64977/g.205280 Transcript_64977/m.205280 type:complete len:403 (-) Transcript_64977:38-1246(-)